MKKQQIVLCFEHSSETMCDFLFALADLRPLLALWSREGFAQKQIQDVCGEEPPAGAAFWFPWVVLVGEGPFLARSFRDGGPRRSPDAPSAS